MRWQEAGGWVHNDRLHGVLAVSRAFGDVEHKLLKEKCWDKKYTADPLIAVPVGRPSLVALEGCWLGWALVFLKYQDPSIGHRVCVEEVYSEWGNAWRTPLFVSGVGGGGG